MINTFPGLTSRVFPPLQATEMVRCFFGEENSKKRKKSYRYSGIPSDQVLQSYVSSVNKHFGLGKAFGGGGVCLHYEVRYLGKLKMLK